ncbi:MAG: carbohydrate-binding domain-containing protein [Clostridia bacterium]|nr:carbohydrate-binding domain-containing protein [Clostridia bacterium]
MKRIIALALALAFVLMLASCGDEEQTPNTPSTPSTQSSSTNNPNKPDDNDEPTTPPDDNTPVGPEQGDEIVDTTRPTVKDVLSEALDVFSAPDTFGNEGKISSYTDYTNIDVSSLEGGGQYEIKNGGIFRITGKTSNGQIYINLKKDAPVTSVTLLLDGVDITYAGSAPAIYAEDCSSVTIILAEGSSNYVSDSYANGENGAIRIRSSNLTLGGKGKLTVKGNAKHGIACTKNIIVNGGNYDITSVKHGIYGKLGITVNGGKYKINSAGSGFKSGDDEVGSEVEGSIVINSCSALIKSSTNGINSYGTVEINNGRIEVKADSRAINATKNITLNGGTMIFSTSKDAIKSEADISIQGSANVKIETNGNGIEAVNVTISTEGVVFIQTYPIFEEDINGEYTLENGEYVLIEGTEPVYDRYTLIECKGIEADEKISISGGTVGIDTYEDALNATTIDLSKGQVAIATQKDGMDASDSATVRGSINVNIIDSEKGIKATNTVTLNEGSTTIVANTDAIKADVVNVVKGKHILFEKVEYVTSFTIRGGTFVSISTTKNPLTVTSAIPNAYGVVNNKELCVSGQMVTFMMGGITETVTLPKSFIEKMCVLYAVEAQGECKLIIGDNVKTEILTQGKFYQ